MTPLRFAYMMSAAISTIGVMRNALKGDVLGSLVMVVCTVYCAAVAAQEPVR